MKMSPTHRWVAPVFVMMLWCGVSGSHHMLGYVAEKVMHPVNEVGGYL